MKKTLLSIIMLCLCFSITCSAAIPYNGYTYDEWNNAIPSAVGYQAVRTISSDREGKVVFNNPQDMVIDKNGLFIILNTENNEVDIMDQSFKLVRILKDFKDKNNKISNLNKARGIFSKNGELYIADTENERVLITDYLGNIQKIITRPDSQVYPKEKYFKPTKVMADKSGNIYVLCLGIYQGAVCFNSDGKFVEFYGSNKVVITAALLADMVWKKIFTKEQSDYTTRYVPVEYTNFATDNNDLIYTCTDSSDTGEIRKLNATGDNLFDSTYNFGDQEISYYKSQAIDTSFVDVTVDEKGFVYGLDKTRGRIFQYDEEGEPVFIFGANGDQVGTFKSPVAIDNYQGKIYVLDMLKYYIVEFSLS